MIGCKMKLTSNCACTTYSLYMLLAIYVIRHFHVVPEIFRHFVLCLTTSHLAVDHSAPSLVSFCCRVGGWLASHSV